MPNESLPGRGEVRVEVRDGLGWITVARPEKKNALTNSMWSAIPGAVRSLAARDDVVGIVLQGAEGNFGAGADLEDVARATESEDAAREYCTGVVTALVAVATVPRPTLALVRGLAVGGGAELAIATDARFGDSSTSISFPFARVGVVPDRFTLARLASLVGLSPARRLVFTGDTLDASQALAIGLLDEVAAEEDLATRASLWASPLRRGSMRTRAGMKRGLLEREAHEDVARLIEPLVDSFLSGEVRAAALRFLAKNAP